MTSKKSVDECLYLRSYLPGRLRWDIRGLQNNPILAKDIEIALRQYQAVIEVKANLSTSRLLVTYSHQTGNGVLTDDSHVAHIRALIFAQMKLKSDTQDTLSAGIDNVLPVANKSLFSLIKSVETDKTSLWTASGLSFLNATLSMGSSLLLGGMLASVLSGGFTVLTRHGIGPVGQLALLGGLYFASKTGESYTLYKSGTAWQHYATDIEHNLRLKTFAHVENQEMKNLEGQHSSQLVSRIHDDTVSIRRFLTTVPHSLITKGSVLVGAGLVFIFTSPTSFVLTLLPAPLLYLASQKYHQKTNQQYFTQGDREESVKKQLANNIAGLPVVKSFTAEAYEQQKLAEASQAMQQSTRDAHEISLKYSQLTNLAVVISCTLPGLYGGYQVLQGAMSTPMYMVQSFLVPEVALSMRGIDREYDIYQNAAASATRITNLLSTPLETTKGTQQLPLNTIRGEINFDNISFSYQDSGKIFDHFTLHVPPHQSVALVGSTGSGKSTLLKLLLRFYAIEDGQVTLDGHNINDLDLTELRQSISLVSQEVFLFEGTIYDNILYGRPDASFEEVVAAAEAAETMAFISALPQGFETNVGERGLKLSGGQKQRVSIARAILKNSPILIMDEATSAIDNETEGAIQRSITRISKDRTTIIVAHRLSTIRYVDQIYLLNNGCVQEQGNHEALLALNGSYAALWKLQTGEQNIINDIS